MRRIKYYEYLKAKELVTNFELHISESKFNINDIKLNQKVLAYNSRIYWVSEINGLDLLVRTTEDENDPNYDDFSICISEVEAVID